MSQLNLSARQRKNQRPALTFFLLILFLVLTGTAILCKGDESYHSHNQRLMFRGPTHFERMNDQRVVEHTSDSKQQSDTALDMIRRFQADQDHRPSNYAVKFGSQSSNDYDDTIGSASGSSDNSDNDESDMNERAPKPAEPRADERPIYFQNSDNRPISTHQPNPRRIDEARRIDERRLTFEEAIPISGLDIANEDRGLDAQLNPMDETPMTSSFVEQQKAHITQRQSSASEHEKDNKSNPQPSKLGLLLSQRRGSNSPLSKTDMAIEYLRNILKSKQSSYAIKSSDVVNSTESSAKFDNQQNLTASSPSTTESQPILTRPVFSSPITGNFPLTAKDDDKQSKQKINFSQQRPDEQAFKSIMGSMTRPSPPPAHKLSTLNEAANDMATSTISQQQQRQINEYREGALYRAPSEPLIGTPLGGEYDESSDDTRRPDAYPQLSTRLFRAPNSPFPVRMGPWQQLESPLGYVENAPLDLTTSQSKSANWTQTASKSTELSSGNHSPRPFESASPVVSTNGASNVNYQILNSIPAPVVSVSSSTTSTTTTPAPAPTAVATMATTTTLATKLEPYESIPKRQQSQNMASSEASFLASLDILANSDNSSDPSDIGLSRADMEAIRLQLLSKRPPRGSLIHTTTADNRLPLLLDALRPSEALFAKDQSAYPLYSQGAAASGNNNGDLSASQSVQMPMFNYQQDSYENSPPIEFATQEESLKHTLSEPFDSEMTGGASGQPPVLVESLRSYLEQQTKRNNNNSNQHQTLDSLLEYQYQQATREQQQADKVKTNAKRQLDDLMKMQATRPTTNINSTATTLNDEILTRVTANNTARQTKSIDDQTIVLQRLLGKKKQANKDGHKSLIVYLNHPRASDASSATTIVRDTTSDGYALARTISDFGTDEQQMLKQQQQVTRTGSYNSSNNGPALDNDGLSVVVLSDTHKYKKIVLLISSKGGGLKLIPIVKDLR